MRQPWVATVSDCRAATQAVIIGEAELMTHDLSYLVVPEPGSGTLILLGLTILGGVRRDTAAHVA